MNRQATMSYLHEMGYLHAFTVSRKWTNAFFLSRDETTLVVLFRLRGIDLFITPLPPEAISNDDGRLSIRGKDPGNELSEFFYSGNDCNVHETILQVAHQFAITGTLGNELPPKSGHSRSDLARLNTEAEQWLYEAVCPGDGSPGYLSDGAWLYPKGSTVREAAYVAKENNTLR